LEYQIIVTRTNFQTDAWFRQPTTETHYALGATLHYQLFPGNKFKPYGDYPKGMWRKGNILVHEIGHAYGLKHPYQGDCLLDESFSDYIDDTPRQTGNPFGTCAMLKGRDSCPTLPGKDDLQNYMVATSDDCRSHFTPGQVAFMQNVITTIKPSLVKQLLPSCVASIDSTDSSPDLQPCLEGQVFDNGEDPVFCFTDPNDSTVWAWACCPESLDWPTQSCWQGVPDFNVPLASVAHPRIPTKRPTARPTKIPAKKKRSIRGGRRLR
jgi:hypothetical protein